MKLVVVLCLLMLSQVSYSMPSERRSIELNHIVGVWTTSVKHHAVRLSLKPTGGGVIQFYEDKNLNKKPKIEFRVQWKLYKENFVMLDFNKVTAFYWLDTKGCLKSSDKMLFVKQGGIKQEYLGNKYQQNFESFFKAYALFVKTSKKQNPVNTKEAESIYKDFSEVRTLLLKCDFDVLNQMSAGWGDMTQALLGGIDLFLKTKTPSITEEEKKNYVQASGIVLDRFGEWLSENKWNELVLASKKHMPELEIR